MIIYSGDPRYYKKRRFQYSFLKFIFISSIVICISTLLIMVFVNAFNKEFFESRLGFMKLISFVSGVMGMGVLMLGDGCACPNCKHFFAMEETGKSELLNIDRKYISQIDVETTYETSLTSRGYRTAEVQRYVHRNGERITEHYKHYKRCYICGCIIEKERSSSREEWQ